MYSHVLLDLVAWFMLAKVLSEFLGKPCQQHSAKVESRASGGARPRRRSAVVSKVPTYFTLGTR